MGRHRSSIASVAGRHRRLETSHPGRGTGFVFEGGTVRARRRLRGRRGNAAAGGAPWDGLLDRGMAVDFDWVTGRRHTSRRTGRPWRSGRGGWSSRLVEHAEQCGGRSAGWVVAAHAGLRRRTMWSAPIRAVNESAASGIRPPVAGSPRMRGSGCRPPQGLRHRRGRRPNRRSRGDRPRRLDAETGQGLGLARTSSRARSG